MRTRAYRRWRRQLRKLKVTKQSKQIFEGSRWHPIYINTRCRCSCYLCGNPRKHFREPTYQELKAS